MTIDEKISYTFEYQVNYYARFSRRAFIREPSHVEIFEDTDDNTINRRRIHSFQTVNAPSWKQALLFTFSHNMTKIRMKDSCMFFGNGKIISENGIVLYDSDKSFVGKALFFKPELKPFGDIFIKTVLPTLTRVSKCLNIKESSDIHITGQLPDAFGSEMDAKLTECAIESLEFLEIN